jgi:hypothetical protein
MDYSIDDYCWLVIKADAGDIKHWASYAERHELLEDIEDGVHEMLCCNGPFQFISPAVCGDLTDADMMGVTDQEVDHDGPAYSSPADTTGGVGSGWISTSPGKAERVIARWAYMNYQVRDWREELLETGRCVWEGGFVDRENDAVALRSLLCISCGS